MPQSYAFLMNVRSLLDATTFQLAEGHELRRANNDEIEGIKRTTDKLNAGMFSNYRLWEDRLEQVHSKLPKEEWRYHVVAFRGNNGILQELTDAFDLSRIELEVGFTISHLYPGLGESIVWSDTRFFHVLKAAQWSSDFLVDVSTADVSDIVSIHASLRSYDHSVLDLKGPLIQMNHLKGLPHGSPLRFLGYFGILESLLTHPPRPIDTIDSITRQLKTKLTLLDHRFLKAIDYSGFGEMNSEKVWTKMYAYRSAVAHGGVPDFTDKDLAALKSPEQALKLLKETIKALIRHALNEPQLILDLREC